ncbi:predicted protein [Arabidopsis lyrata subsp. lyrata]|uniref:Predicted protein n=1 Tax=Arabidopsis lyrata subsp. lyrata TaxID=81972 RepID=D7ML16_ARALL|nr:predicted protein [Arabidopsis lyrata subsp. lyrata]
MRVLVNCPLGCSGLILEGISGYFLVWLVWIIEAARRKLRFFSDHGWMRFQWFVYGFVSWICLWESLQKLYLRRSTVSISPLGDGVLQELVLYFGLDRSFWIVAALMEESQCRIRGKVKDSPFGSRNFWRSSGQAKSRDIGIDISSVLGIRIRLIMRIRNPCRRSTVWDLISIFNFNKLYLVESHCSSGDLAIFYNVRIIFEFHNACTRIIAVQVLIGDKVLFLFAVFGDTIRLGISSLIGDWVYIKNIQGNEDHNPMH